MPNTKLVLLGTGTPNCLPGRFQQSTAIVVDEQAYIIDCGGGTIQRIAEAFAKGVDALALTKLTRLFLTHLHPDHTVGLADFIIAPWVQMRTAPLLIYGPQGTKQLVEHLLKAYEVGVGEHKNGLCPINHPLLVTVHEYDAGLIYEDDRLSVEAFHVQHGALDAFGLKFVTAAKTIVHSGDTCALPIMAEKARGCDVLVHEVYCAASLAKRSQAWQRYHSTAHTSAVELATIANEAQPGLLVLNHQLVWEGHTEQDLMQEISERYDGRVAFGRDLDIFEL